MSLFTTSFVSGFVPALWLKSTLPATVSRRIPSQKPSQCWIVRLPPTVMSLIGKFRSGSPPPPFDDEVSLDRHEAEIQGQRLVGIHVARHPRVVVAERVVGPEAQHRTLSDRDVAVHVHRARRRRVVVQDRAVRDDEIPVDRRGPRRKRAIPLVTVSPLYVPAGITPPVQVYEPGRAANAAAVNVANAASPHRQSKSRSFVIRPLLALLGTERATLSVARAGHRAFVRERSLSMGWRRGELWLDADVGWFREGAGSPAFAGAAAAPVPGFAQPPGLLASRLRRSAWEKRRDARRARAAAIAVSPAVMFALAGLRSDKAPERISSSTIRRA